MVRAVFGPVLVVLLIGGAGQLAGVHWTPAYAIAAAWLLWIAYRSGRRAIWVWGRIVRRQPWRDAYGQSIYMAGASRRRAFVDTRWAWIRDPWEGLLAGMVGVLFVVATFNPTWVRPSKLPDPRWAMTWCASMWAGRDNQ